MFKSVRPFATRTTAENHDQVFGCVFCVYDVDFIVVGPNEHLSALNSRYVQFCA